MSGATEGRVDRRAGAPPAAARQGGGDERIEQAARGRASSPRASASSCCSTPAPSSSSTRSSTHRCPDFGMEEQQHPGRRRGHRLRHDRRPHGLRLRAGLHRLRRLAVGDLRREDLQGHGPGDGERRAGDRPQRLGRRAHPGRRRLARRLRRHLPAQHARLAASCRRSPPSWGRAPAAPSTRRRSPTSSSWSRARATCSSPAPTSSRR